MSIVLDSGALIAVESGDLRTWAILRREFAAGRGVLTHAGVVGQVWRGGSRRQARLSRALVGIEVRPIDEDLGRRAGVLLGQTGGSDVIDAALVLVSNDGDEILTGDAADLSELVAASGKLVDLIEV